MEAVALSPSTDVASEQVDIAASIGSEFKEYKPLYERFGLADKAAPHVERNLAVIWQWAKDHAETKDKDAILWQVTKLANRIGDAPYGSAPYTKVLNYISEYNRMKQAEDRLRELEK